MSAAIDLHPFHLDTPRGPLFCLLTRPGGGARPTGGLVYLHPFAEEMHKSRRMAALQARALAARGLAVLQVDLTGCGDSAGDFGDATWPAWLDDARRAHAWLTAETGVPVGFWGLRVGASLAVEAARDLAGVDRLLLWQPVVAGEVFLNQFLRIRLAGEMLADGQARSGTKALRARLDAGEAVEVGGYMLCPDMARALAALDLIGPPPCPTRWLEVGAEAGADVAPASQRVVDAWRAAGVDVTTATVAGDPFWITQEITECPALIEATLTG